VGGYLTLTNSLEFWFENGFVNGYRTTKSYYDLQDPRRIPEFYGKLNLTKDEAIRRARASLIELGYDLKDIFADQDPEVEMPPRVGTNIVSVYSVRWIDPIESGPSVIIDLSGVDGAIHKMRFFSTVFWRERPRIKTATDDVVPEQQLSLNPRTNQLARSILEQATELANKISLPFESPLNPDLVDRFDIQDSGNRAQVKLKNGYWLYYERGYLRGFSAPESVYKRQLTDKRLPIESYLGGWNMTKEEALALARTTVRKTTSPIKELNLDDQPEQVLSPKQIGSYIIPRYFFQWTARSAQNTSVAVADVQIEIDASTKAVEYLYVWNGHLWRDLNMTMESPNKDTNSVKPQ